MAIEWTLLDPGHGAEEKGIFDPGTQHGTASESLLNLKIAKRAYEMLYNYKGINLTRTDIRDKLLGLGVKGLNNRAQIAIGGGAKQFISIHCNSAGSPNAHGLQVYYQEGGIGQDLARHVYQHLFSAALFAGYDFTSQWTGVRPANYQVLRKCNNAKIPACLIEYGFLSNEQDRAWIASAEGQLAAAYGLARAVMSL